MRVLDLFSGIGGFSLGLERAGMRTVAFCEIDPYCRRVLAKHWPAVPIFGDIRELTGQIIADAIGGQLQDQSGWRNGPDWSGEAEPRYDGTAGDVANAAWDVCPQQATGGAERQRTGQCGQQGIDVICGGFPCQDISVAGKGAGIAGERSGLWTEYARVIGELRPRYVIVENVSALLGRGLSTVLGDLAALGYDAEWHCIPASAVGAPHRRDRVWIVAHASSIGERESQHETTSEPPDGRPRLESGFSGGRQPFCGAEQDVAYPNGGWRRTNVAGRHNTDGTDTGRSEADGVLGEIRQAGGTPSVANTTSHRWLKGGQDSDGLRVAESGDRVGEPIGTGSALSNPDGTGCKQQCWGVSVRSQLAAAECGDWWQFEPPVGRVAHGVPARVDRLRGLGNAIVPQIAEIIGLAIMQTAMT